MKRSLKLLLGSLLIYALLLALLLWAESGAEGSRIRTIGEAIWYSLITITTVGYGDLTPVTPVGRLVGLVFAFCSIGILTALIALGLRLIRGGLLPTLRLFFSRSRPWYVFTEGSPEALLLASSLLLEDPSALPIFPTAAKNAPKGAVKADRSTESLVRMRRGGSMSFFFLGENGWKNYAAALRSAQAGLPSYCMTEVSPVVEAPEALHPFSLNDAMARLYWQSEPLRPEETCIVLIGSGGAAEALLERALLTNVFPLPRRIEYHCFGVGESFARLRRELTDSLLPEGRDGDLLVFHGEHWAEQAELLRRADRVLLCAAEDEENLRVFNELRRGFVCRGQLRLRLKLRVEGVPSFGALDETLTPENVLRSELDRRAMLLNEIYNRNAGMTRSWRELSPFLRASNIAAADHIPVKLRILLGESAPAEPKAADYLEARRRFDALDPDDRELLRETEHRRWLRFHRLYNWHWAEQRNDKERLHPALLPYWALSDEDQAKDDYAWQLLSKLAETEKGA